MTQEKQQRADGQPPAPKEPNGEVERLRRQLLRLTERHENALSEIDRLQKKLARSEETLSFQLGYALIQSAKSIDAALSLPATLWALRKEATRRRVHSESGPGVGTTVAAVVEIAARTLASRAGKLLKRSDSDSDPTT